MRTESDEISIPELEDGGISIDDSVDNRAEELLELEAELTSMSGSSPDWESNSNAYESGVVVGAERVITSEVPQSYPISPTPVYALRLDVRLDESRVTEIYLDWPDRLTEDADLIRLLNSIDLSIHSFADILGHEIPLERVGKRYVAYLPDETTSASPYWFYGFIVFFVLWTIQVFWYYWLPGDIMPYGTGVMLWIGLIFSIHIDSNYVRAKSTWTPHKWFWTVGAVPWILHVPVGLVYLYKRYRATFPGE